MDQPRLHQLADQVERAGVAEVGRPLGQRDIEWISGDGRSCEPHPRRGRQRGQLAVQRRPDAVGHAQPVVRGASIGGRDAARELQQEERVAAALAIHVLAFAGWDSAEQLARRGARERCDVQAQRLLSAHRSGERAGQGRRELRGAEPERQQHAGAGWMSQEVDEQLDRRGIGPVHVVERDEDVAVGGQRSEEVADGAIGPIALLRRHRRSLRSDRLEGREDAGQLRREVAGERGAPRRAQSQQPVVQGVGERAERQLTLELGGAALEDDVSAPARCAAQLVEEAALADPGIAGDRDNRLAIRLHELLDERQLTLPAAQRRGHVAHWPDSRRRHGNVEGFPSFTQRDGGRMLCMWVRCGAHVGALAIEARTDRTPSANRPGGPEWGLDRSGLAPGMPTADPVRCTTAAARRPAATYSQPCVSTRRATTRPSWTCATTLGTCAPAQSLGCRPRT